MRSPLSQFQTPTAPRRASRFFRVWSSSRLPWPTDHSAYFGLANFIKPTLSAVDVSQLKHLLYRCQRNSQGNREISVNGFVEKIHDYTGHAPDAVTDGGGNLTITIPQNRN